MPTPSEMILANGNSNGYNAVPVPYAAPPQSLAPALSFDQMERQAKYLVDGGMFPVIKTIAQAMSAQILAMEEGKTFVQIVREYDFIPGRMPAKKAIAILADFQAHGGKFEYLEYSNDAVEMRFSYGGAEVTVRWDQEAAMAAGYYTRNALYKSSPRSMYRSRCSTDGVRAVMPGIMVGIYTPEEYSDMPPVPVEEAKPARSLAARNVTPQQAPELLPAQAEVNPTAEAKAARAAAARAFVEVAERNGYSGLRNETGKLNAILINILVCEVLDLPEGVAIDTEHLTAAFDKFVAREVRAAAAQNDEPAPTSPLVADPPRPAVANEEFVLSGDQATLVEDSAAADPSMADLTDPFGPDAGSAMPTAATTKPGSGRGARN